MPEAYKADPEALLLEARILALNSSLLGDATHNPAPTDTSPEGKDRELSIAITHARDEVQNAISAYHRDEPLTFTHIIGGLLRTPNATLPNKPMWPSHNAAGFRSQLFLTRCTPRDIAILNNSISGELLRADIPDDELLNLVLDPELCDVIAAAPGVQRELSMITSGASAQRFAQRHADESTSGGEAPLPFGADKRLAKLRPILEYVECVNFIPTKGGFSVLLLPGGVGFKECNVFATLDGSSQALAHRGGSLEKQLEKSTEFTRQTGGRLVVGTWLGAPGWDPKQVSQQSGQVATVASPISPIRTVVVLPTEGDLNKVLDEAGEPDHLCYDAAYVGSPAASQLHSAQRLTRGQPTQRITSQRTPLMSAKDMFRPASDKRSTIGKFFGRPT